MLSMEPHFRFFFAVGNHFWVMWGMHDTTCSPFVPFG